jgi:CPA1 family monovalent cation:H+ antiporter
LIGQGLLMPRVLEWLGLGEIGRNERVAEEAEEFESRRRTIEAVLRRLDELAAQRELPAEIVDPLRAHHLVRLQQLDYRMGPDEEARQLARLTDELEQHLIDAEREHLYALMCEGRIKDDARRHIENELDLREANLRRSTPEGGS